MASINDPDYQAMRAGAREALARISSTPPGSPWQFEDNVDSTHPLYIDFVLPNLIKPSIAKLSLKFRLYRTYNSFTLSSTGTDATGSSGHSHSHAHTIPIGSAGGSSTIQWSGAGNGLQSSPGISGNTSAINTDASGESGHSHSHSHTISGSSVLGVSESATTTSITAMSIDGTDITAALGGGPWASDLVDLDLTSQMPIGDGKWHTLALTVSSFGRMIALLRLG